MTALLRHEAQPASLAGVIHAWATVQPQVPAVTFLADGEGESGRWTYGMLDRRARELAARLIAINAGGQPVLLMLPHGLDFVAALCGCLYAGAIAVPVPPAGGARGAARLKAIAGDARPLAVLTTTGAPGARSTAELAASGLAGVALIRTDAEDAGAPVGALPVSALPVSISTASATILQYTSGSTSAPKGVVITTAALIANLEMLRAAMQMDQRSRFVSWLPLFHDMGLVTVVLAALFCGASTVLMPPLAFLQRPVRWLQAISRYRATISGAPNFAYGLCVERCRREDLAGLDLGSWRVAFCAAEPIRAETLERFADAFSGCGFRATALYPAYGLAEATVFASGAPVGRGLRIKAAPVGAGEAASLAARPRRLVSCGRAWQGAAIRIVDPVSRAPLPDGQVGEIWIVGPHVAAGYWRNPGATAETFAACLGAAAGPAHLRTGDLGFLADGELVITGRCNDVMSIRGVNIHPEDVEQVIAGSHAALSGRGAAFAVDTGQEDAVVAVHEVGRTWLRRVDPAAVAVAAFNAVGAELGIRLFDLLLVRPGGIPLTTSGKVQRFRCKELYAAGLLPALAGHDHRWLGRHRV
jgi:acyl-CoA synthetase (AMP-forming)/AMP-acid ligase II